MTTIEVKNDGQLYFGNQYLGIVKSIEFLAPPVELDLQGQRCRTEMMDITIKFTFTPAWRWGNPWIYLTMFWLRVESWIGMRQGRGRLP